MQRCTSDVETVRVFLASQVVEIGRSILLVVFVAPVLFSMSAKLAWVALGLLPVLVVYSILFFGKLIHIFTEVDEAEGKLTTVLQENLTGIRVVRSFGRSDFESEKFAAANVSIEACSAPSRNRERRKPSSIWPTIRVTFAFCHFQ